VQPTLPEKHRSTVSKVARKYAATIETPAGPRKCFQAELGSDRRTPLVARFGGIPLKRQKKAVLTDRQPYPTGRRRKELITRLLTGACEVCGHTEDIDVHHIRKLADLDEVGTSQPEWAQLMASRRRKTLVVCVACHAEIHPGQPAA
jgi:hypothetical protein